MGLAKILLFVFNLVFVILGIVLIISGILVHTSDQSFDVLLEDSTFGSVGTLTIILGVIVFVVAFAGCCGAIKESKLLLTIFIVLLCIILVLELAGAILAYVFRGSVESTVTEVLLEGLHQYNSSADPNTEEKSYSQAWDKAQEEFKCCGVSMSSDWSTNASFPVGSYPDSCCMTVTPGCGENAAPADIYSEGCKMAIVGKIAGNLILSGTVCIVILLAEILGIIFACCVIRDVGKGETA
ncbi:CD63 antigen-like [Apostichopus japonicus]|uniref:CD63 antigen-like n=1 Tax=Stichopus japonicus TaxID=307972 RepID=UPI003AB37D7B